MQRAEGKLKACGEKRESLNRELSLRRALIGTYEAEQRLRDQIDAERDKALDESVKLKNQTLRNAEEIESLKRRVGKQHDGRLAHLASRRISVLTDQVMPLQEGLARVTEEKRLLSIRIAAVVTPSDRVRHLSWRRCGE